ncbi:Glutaredoxin-like protein nrdH [Cedecea neteri]|uniref:Glutaredoxin-like protein nrdH n=1 Tax=Cedecea neteri TaxID=158822 RepID=A0A2X2TGQ4_9ENTR|nr:Glutaredoxin-like protein nrdH [Cedecea neteri]
MIVFSAMPQKRAMESRGFAFEMINLDLNPEAADDLRAKGFRQLPVVVTEAESWSGFSPGYDSIASALPPAYEHPRLLLQRVGKHPAFYRTPWVARLAHSSRGKSTPGSDGTLHFNRAQLMAAAALPGRYHRR